MPYITSIGLCWAPRWGVPLSRRCAWHLYLSFKKLQHYLQTKLSWSQERRHRFRRDRRSFDGTVEIWDPPRFLTGTEIYNCVSCITNVFGKSKTKKRRTNTNEDNWEKRSIFFALSYWKDLLLRHNLDLMHVERNVCDNFVETFT